MWNEEEVQRQEEEVVAKAKLGSGKRFAAVAKAAGGGKKGAAIAAAAGRKKYGAAKFNKMAATGRRRAARARKG